MPAKDLVHDNIVRRNPADPHEVRQALEDPPGEPVVDEGGAPDDEEQAVPANLPAVRLGGVGRRVVVQGVEERAVDKVRGPDHGGGPHEEAARQAREAVARAEGGDAEEDLEGPAEVLLVPQLLGEEDVGRVKDSATVGGLATPQLAFLIRKKKKKPDPACFPPGGR